MSNGAGTDSFLQCYLFKIIIINKKKNIYYYASNKVSINISFYICCNLMIIAYMSGKKIEVQIAERVTNNTITIIVQSR